ncbi:MAG TPA: TonB-dependent receptor [Sphingomicrobium sp.]|nr:TonB-dependent receptor [Sphingomicrobium sp.]
MGQHQSGAAIAICASLLLVSATSAKAESQGRYAFDLPAEDLSHAIRDLAVLTGQNVIAPDDLIRSRATGPLSGKFTAEQALAKLLEGTGLTYRRLNGALVVERGPATSVAEKSADSAGDAIVVTGTHVRSAAPTSPVLTITRHDIDLAQPSSVEELMRQLPQNLSAGVAQENFGVSGAGADITDHGAGINLRGLGQRATLVLVDGRRVAPSGTGSFVDVSLIPISAIDRIEILTDGASAIYGSDAVAGVVNIILKKDFQGLESVLQAGTSTDGGGNQFLAGLTAGTAWHNGNAMLSYEFRDEGEIKAGDRPFTINLPSIWSLFPKERRHSVYGSAHQELAPGVTLDVTGNYSARDTDRSYFVAGPLIPVSAHAEARSLGGTATLGLDLGAAWRAEATGSYFRSRTEESQFQPEGSGLVNIFNTLNSVAEIEVKADGNLIEVPAGAVKLAIGAQARREHYSSLFQTAVNPPTPQSGSRTVTSLYGELNAPLFTSLNRRPGLEQLVFTAAGRLEHYENLGSSFDPKFGMLWSPIEGLKFRSSYGTSFRAPLLSETLGLYNVYLFPASLLYLDPAQAPAGVGAALIGSNPNVRPETSRSFSAGTEWAPKPIPGLNLSATYYAIRFTNRIALPTDQIVVVGDPALEPIVNRNPDLSLVNDIFAGAGQVLDFSGPGFTPGGAGPGDVRVIVDARVANTAETRTSGLDLGLDYAFALGADHFNFSLNANKIFRFDDRLTSASPVIHTLDTPYHPVDLRGRAGLSWSRGPISAVVFANYTTSYRDNRTATSLKIGSFTTFDAGVAWTSSSAGPSILRQLRLSLNVENLFDADPPTLLPDPGSTVGVGYDPVNATGRGRTISLQLRKHW